MRVFITGGRGLVGRNLVEHLSRSHDVVAPSRAELDLLDAGAVAARIRDDAPDLVVHCAGIVGGIQANIRWPTRFLVENFELGKNVVLASAGAGVSRLINLGSSCMYPRDAPNPLREEEILAGKLEPTNEGYALAKVAVQRLCAYVSRERGGCSYKTIVPCNLFGRWDNFDPEYSHMVPAVIRKLHEAKVHGRSVVEIWGSGTARREFMYAGDLAGFVAYAIPKFDRMPEFLNVGTGRDHSVDEYYGIIGEVVGYSGDFVHDLARPEGMEQKVVDTTLLSDFGWRAASSLEDGLRATYSFFLERYASK